MFDDTNKFNTLYGEPGAVDKIRPTFYELDDAGEIIEPTLIDVPAWHTKWEINRDGGMGYNDEWEPGKSWTASKIVRPSYSLESVVRLVVTIYGRYRSSRCQPYTWSASVEFRNQRRPVGATLKKHGCKSLRDAMRKAAAIQIDGAIANLIKEAFTPERARALFRRNEAGEYEPFVSMCGYDTMGLPVGNYFETHWVPSRKYEERGMYSLSGHTIERSYWGYGSGGGTPEYNTNMRDKLGCWLPAPVYREWVGPVP